MKKIVKKLILYYLAFVIVKSIISYFIPAPSAFSDEYIYARLARSLFYGFDFTIHGIDVGKPLPLYSLVLSPAYSFGKMAIVYPVMKVINSIISSLIIFPAFLLAKEFITTRRALLIAILISLLPSSFSITPYILAENLFYPLFLFSIYFIFKTLNSDKTYWPVLAGLFIGLTYLTRIIGVVLIAVLVVVFIYKLIAKEKVNKSHFFIIFLVAALVVVPWLIRTFLLQNTILGGYTEEALTVFELHKFLGKYIIQFILYIGLLIIPSAIFLPMLISKKIFSKKTRTFAVLALSSIFFILVVAANHNVMIPSDFPVDAPFKHLPWLAGRLVGRYVDAVIPIILILGAICIREKVSLKKTILTSAILIFSSQIVLTRLFPVNHISMTHIGVINEFLLLFTRFPVNMYIMAVILGIIPFMLYKSRLHLHKLLVPLGIFLILLNVLNFGLIYYNSDTFWHDQEQMQLGIWFDSNNIETSNVLFDKRDCTSIIYKLDQSSICEPSGYFTIIGFWLNDNIKVETPDNLENTDFIISRHEFDLPIVKQSESGIKIYKNEK